MKKDYIKVIEVLGRVIKEREDTIETLQSEVEMLRRKIEMIEAYADSYKEKVSNS